MRVSSRRAHAGRAVLAGVLSAVLLGLVLGTNVRPAAATHGYTSEADQRDIQDPAHRRSFVLDPGLGAFLNRTQIYNERDGYGAFGFTPNFIWYAPEVVRDVAASQRWTFCTVPHTPGTMCPTINVDGDDSNDNNTVGQTFRGPMRLHLYEYGGGFIARVCGNFTPTRPESPVPTITGTKFDDRNGNDVQDGDEAGVPGWTMTLTRVTSAVSPSQELKQIETATTDGNGFYRFRLDGHLPGTYVVTETGRDGWVPTTSTERVVVVDEGIGAKEFGGNDFGNRREADIAKVGFRLVDPPTEIDADTTHRLTVEAVVVNNGPMPEVEAEDTMEASGPPDCTVTPPRQSQRRTLRRGQPVTLTFHVDVLCTEPSDHTFSFRDQLTLLSEGVTERQPGNNTRAFDHTIPVIDYADLRLHAVALDCPERTDINTAFTCEGVASITNDGPYEVPKADVSLALNTPTDCTVTTTVRHDDVVVPVGELVDLPGTWTFSCATRSYHPMLLTATVALDHVHVREVDPDDDSATTNDTVEVFEPADLRIVEPLRIACGERRVGPSQFTCTVITQVENGGPATAVASRLDVTLSGAPDCVFDPAGSHTERFNLDAGGRRTFTETWRVSCTAPTRHTFLAVSTIATDEPHAEDRTLANNTAVVRWVPMDVKPGSDPSSVNIGKQGTVPFAVLSTPDFQASTDVVVDSLLFGRTGYEDSVLGCKASTEDVNLDGFGDLVCHADTQATGLQCRDTEMVLTGHLADGTPFESQDTVKPTGC